ncbi:cytochrome P450 family protein [Saccharopolyspora flava]|uniref:Cytochrome P450 n=1 Tax=Saccharopolyspora flava TaxID=95161 RepID=A0A1I6SZL9_9PSEU|nr:cytochrome P450 [Saccharopolyspora flava]SFS82465.1 Cytochrome P450 [Saccharopolyspora flava]
MSEVPLIELDPLAADHHGEAARMRAAGTVIRVLLPGGVRAWAVTEHAALAELVADPRVSKDWRNWTAVRQGEISDDWPLIGMVKVTNMVTADGTEHQRLRRLVTRAFTRGRVEDLRPRVQRIVADLLDDLPRQATAGVVDLRPHFAYPVPMNVICELVGVPVPWRAELRTLVDSIFRTNTTPEEVLSTQRDRLRLLNRLVDLRRSSPGDDLTSALLAAGEADAEALTAEELVDTLWLLLTAGHETTLSLILNTTRALLTHPDQLELARAGAWAEAVEETLRWDAPIGNFLARYPLEDITLAGVTIPRGEAIIAPYSGVGRDPAQHGPGAERFDLTRNPQRHLAFGGGPHFCLGAHLARLEAVEAVSALFARYPELALASDELLPVPSLFSNSAQRLPVRL